jgi:hypothetical protein
MDFPIELNIAELRPKEFTMRRLAEAILENMTGIVQEGLMYASTDPDPQVGPAPMFDGKSWQSWETSEYRYSPINVQVNSVILESDPTANRLQLIQNKDGVIATLDEAYGIRDTVILQEGLVTVDWSKGNDFLCVLSGNRQSAFYMAHSKAGMEIDILLVNNGTNQLVGGWDALIQWPGGAPPVMPSAKSGTSARQKVTLRNINGTIYGEFLSYAHADPAPYNALQPFLIP